MKRFTLIFSFIFSLAVCLPGALVAGTAAKVTLIMHRDAPITYDGRTALAENELIQFVLYLVDEGDAVPSPDGAMPFSVSRDGGLVKSPDAVGTLHSFAPWRIKDNPGRFPLRRNTFDTDEFIGVSYCLATISDSIWPSTKRAFAYVVFFNTKTVPADLDSNGEFESYVCSGRFENLGKSEYLASTRVVPLGELLPSEGGGVGPGGFPGMGGGAGIADVFYLICPNYTSKIEEDLARCYYVDMAPITVVNPTSFAVSVPDLPAEVGGMTNPEEIQSALTPAFGTNADKGGSELTLSLPAIAKGLMRYTVYTTTDLSKPFGEWSLLDEVLKNSEAKKVLANESGMSYTLIRVEDHAAPTIVLPKIGEKRFYRVVGE